MSDDKKKPATKEYVVVFDQLGVATGEYTPQGPNMPQRPVITDHFRGETVSLTDEDAERHLESGAVIAKSDRRAKLVKPNERLQTGVRRDPALAVSALPLEETPPAVAGTGATRTADGKLGTKAELEKLSVTELKRLAAEHGVEVGRGDTKPKLAAKLARVRVAETAAGDETVNPGQGDDQSPPPVEQPSEPPADAE